MFLRKWLIEGFLMLCFVQLSFLSTFFCIFCWASNCSALFLGSYSVCFYPSSRRCWMCWSQQWILSRWAIGYKRQFLSFFQLLFPGTAVSTLLSGVICIQVSVLCMRKAWKLRFWKWLIGFDIKDLCSVVCQYLVNHKLLKCCTDFKFK